MHRTLRKHLFLLILTGASLPGYAQVTLKGKVTDKQTGESLPGVTIYIPDFKTGAVSDSDGTYKITNLPGTRLLIQATLVGYKMVAEKINLSDTSVLNIAMDESVNELNELVVTGLSKSAEKNRTPTPVTTLSQAELKQISSTNIIDAIATQPGISQVTTGAAISKPVIRGLGTNRVLTVNDGVRQEGQQWGDEHGIEIDENAVDKVEILKGPASLAYGSDALAGVIHMQSAPTLPEGKITANLVTNYQTNAGLFGYSGNFSGNRKGILWDVRYSNKSAHSYNNAYDGFVFNSGFKEHAFSGIAGMNKSWGFSHLNFSVFSLKPGIPEGERDSATGQFTKAIALNDSTEGEALATPDDLQSYSPFTPYQEIHHYKAVLNNSFVVGDGLLKAILGFQQNQRKEFADILKKDQYGLFLLLNTFTYDFRYNLPEKNNLSITVGIGGMEQNSKNKGTEFLIPDYTLFDIGFFTVAKKNLGQFDISAGLRYDSRNETGEDLYLNAAGEVTGANDSEAVHPFTAFQSTYSGVSGSLGMTYQFSEKVYTKLNLSRGFRAPNIAEISSNGVHEGSANYILGVPGLDPENSFQVDYSIGLNSHHVTAEADLFTNTIDNYIFQGKLESVSGGDSITDGYSTFKYASGDAHLAGGEIFVDIHPHPLDWLHFENTFSYVQAMQKDQPDSMKYLPLTPPAKWTSELRATAKKTGKFFENSYLKFGVDIYFRQDKFYAAYGTETATPGYVLVSAGVGTNVTSKNRTLFSLFISANNLADVAYQSHLNRLKYLPANNATGRTGIYNMGRNISFRLLIPMDFSKKQASQG